MQAQPNATWFAKAREIVASAMDGGWTTLEIRDMFDRVIQEENDARRAEAARKLYGPDNECPGHPAGPSDPMGETVYCDGSCQS